MQSDVELVDAVRNGDVDAFTLLVERYQRLARAAVMDSLRDRHAAEDVLQEVFFTAYRSLPTLRDSSKFGPWLLSIARLQAVRSLRKNAVTVLCVAEVEAVQPESDSRLTETSERLLALVERLPDNERIVVGLRHFDGHSVLDVSAITGRPVGTVTKQLSRAHQRLQRWLNKETGR